MYCIGLFKKRQSLSDAGRWRLPFYEECEDTDIIGVVRKVCRPSGKKIETDSMCWRLESRLWLGLGGCRGMVLRVLNRLGCCLLFDESCQLGRKYYS